MLYGYNKDMFYYIYYGYILYKIYKYSPMIFYVYEVTSGAYNILVKNQTNNKVTLKL